MDNVLPGFNVLLEGPTGTGKTFSIGTLVDTGLEVFYLACEPGMESLVAYWKDKGKPIPDNFHWHYLAPPKASFSALKEAATKINTMSLDTLAKLPDPNRSQHNQYITLLGVLENFIDQRDGKAYGPVDEWGTDRVLVIDPMTGLNTACMALVVGNKPVRNQSDWGIAQGQLENLLRQLTDGCRCHFVLLAHIERETDPVLGGSKITISTLGKALAPKIPPMFSDVVLSVREGKEFFWSTANPQADLKTRNLALADKLPPSFKPIYDKWLARNAD